MKTTPRFLISSAIASLVATTALFGAEVPTRQGLGNSTPVDATKTPKGLSDSDWSGIRGAYERGRHAIVANQDGTHQARNPGQAWLTKFDARGFTVTPDAGGWSWGLELAGYGEAAEIRQDGGMISYDRGEGLTEWFVNDARGLEQGWTFTKRPDHADTSGPLRLHLAIRGGLRPQVSNEGASVAFLNETGGAALTYGGLKAWDADGKTVQARFAEGESGATGICVVVDDADARYPITVDPIAQQAYLKASNTATDDRFGSCVAISGDTVAISAQYEDSNATGVNGTQTNNSMTNSGAVYVFVRSGTTWSQQAYIKASNTNSYDQFGAPLAISGDTIVAGAPGEMSTATGVNGSQTSNTASMAGAAYVFVRSGTTWSQQAYLKASNTEAGDLFHTVAIDGNTIVVGARYEDSSSTGVNGNQADNSATNSGAAYVFVRSGTTWSQQAYLKASNTGAGDEFGWGVAVSGDTIAVSAGGEDSGATGVNGNQADNSVVNSGALYVFVRSGTTWSQEAYVKPLNTDTEDWFGGPVAISGNTIAAAARGDDSRASGINGDANDNWVAGAGAVHVFVRNGSTWSQQAYIKASNPDVGDDFGCSLGLSNNTLVVGCWWEDSASSGVNGDQSNNDAGDSGAAYVFIRHGTTWRQRGYLKASNTEAGDWFGYSVSVSGDTVVVASQLEGSSATGVNGAQTNNGAPTSGAAYVFTGFEMTSLVVSQPTNGAITGNGYYEFGSTVTVTAAPDPGYLFTGWSGDASGTTNPLAVLMDADKTITANFGPDTNDTDGDGWTNYQEIVVYGTDPTKKDTDGDGVKDSADAFPLDPAETLDTDHDGIGDNADLDDDGDGLSDVDEINIYHTNPKYADSDSDGLSDPDELQVYLTNPMNPDMDGDGLKDGAEINTYGTLPKVADTDGDGFLDGYEVLTGHLPLIATDHPALVAEARTAIEFTFPAASGKTYRIEASFDLKTWTPVEDGIAGNGGEIQRFYSIKDKPKGYFRVEESGP